MLDPVVRKHGPWLLLLLLMAVAAAAMGCVQLVGHARLFAARVTFPLDLEWMEGGMLMHAHRLLHGQALYVPPSLDFIPFLYTPFYPRVLAWLGHVVPLGYTMARAVSLVALTSALLVIAILAWIEVGPAALAVDRHGLTHTPWAPSLRPTRGLALLIALAAAGVVVGGFAFAGGFYDLVRADSLLLLLEALAVALAFAGRGWVDAATAGALISLAFFTKQTASLLGMALGVALLVANWRRGLVYGLAAGITLALGLWTLNHTSHGWFWTYIFRLHQSHEFRWHLAWVQTPPRLWAHEGWVYTAGFIAVGGLALARQLRRADVVVVAAALAGVGTACVGFGTQWAFENAFIPAVYFPALAAAILGTRLAVHAWYSRKAGAAACAVAVTGALLAHNARLGPAPPNTFLPSTADRAAAVRFLETLRALPGDVFIPFHPYYAVLVGKTPHVHRMGVLDIAASWGRPAGLDQAIAQQQFSFIVLDWKSRPFEWPLLEQRYHVVRELRDGWDSTRAFSGAETSPRWILAPTVAR